MPEACCSCENIKKIVSELFDEKLTELKTTVSKKRTLSKWQIFLKECIPKKQDIPFKERIKACSVDYKKEK